MTTSLIILFFIALLVILFPCFVLDCILEVIILDTPPLIVIINVKFLNSWHVYS